MITKDNLKTFSRELLTIVLIALVAFLIIQFFLVEKAIVDGSSMEPNLHDNEVILVNKVAYLCSEPHRGDVIIFKPPAVYPTDKDLIKRVIGLPGETVEMKEGVIYIHQADGNILVLDENNYIDNPSVSYYISDVIPEDCYFVLGDNRNNSTDSRVFGVVSRSDIDGKAWFVISPLSEWGSVLSFNYATS